MDNSTRSAVPFNRVKMGTIGLVGATAVAFGGVVAVTAQTPTPPVGTTPTPGAGLTPTPGVGTPGVTPGADAQTQLVADVSSLLTEHIYQAGMLAAAILDGDNDDRVQRLQEAALANTSDLEQAFQSLATAGGTGTPGTGASPTPGSAGALPSPTANVPGANPQGQDFTSLWNLHLAYYVDYANAVSDGDDDAQQEIRQNLSQWASEFARFAAGQLPGLNEQQVTQGLQMHVTETADIIDALDEDDAQAYEMMREAAQHMAEFAAVLAGAAE